MKKTSSLFLVSIFTLLFLLTSCTTTSSNLPSTGESSASGLVSKNPSSDPFKGYDYDYEHAPPYEVDRKTIHEIVNFPADKDALKLGKEEIWVLYLSLMEQARAIDVWLNETSNPGTIDAEIDDAVVPIYREENGESVKYVALTTFETKRDFVDTFKKAYSPEIADVLITELFSTGEGNYLPRFIEENSRLYMAYRGTGVSSFLIPIKESFRVKSQTADSVLISADVYSGFHISENQYQLIISNNYWVFNCTYSGLPN